MSALTLVMRQRPGEVIDLAGITPNALAGKTLSAIARIRLGSGRRPPTLGEVFELTGDDPATLVFRGLTTACRRLGADLESGTIDASGNVGDELGRAMRGGEIRLLGNAGDAVGCGMRGGRIVVRGNVGRRLGGTVAGATHGMNGGEIVVTKNAGDCAGERMRRGFILIAGNGGSHVGDRMTAGTIAVLGQVGADAGAGLRRGTLLLGCLPAQMSGNFNDCGVFELAIVPVIERHVAAYDRNFARRLAVFRRARRWSGDMAFGGKGEILVADRGNAD